MSDESRAVRKRTAKASYINTNPMGTESIALLGIGVSTLDEKPNAQVKSKQYICDNSTTGSVNKFDSSFDYKYDDIPTNEALEFLTDCAENHLTSPDCDTQLYIVDLDRPAEVGSGTKFHCRKFQACVVPANFTGEDNEMGADGALKPQGDPVQGVWDMEKFHSGENPFTAGWTKPALGTLTVTSIAGTATGDTKLTVAPTLTEGNSYRYQTAATVTLPTVGADCTTMTAWDGTADITATTGNQILVVEVTSAGLAVKAGIATVTSKTV